MASATAVKEFTIASGSTSPVAIDLTGKWSDGLSHTPHAYLIFYHAGSHGSTNTGEQFWGRGMSDGTTHWSFGAAVDDNAVASNGRGYNSNVAPLTEIDLSTAVTGVVNHTSFGADTITLTPSDALTNSIAGFVVAFYDTLGAKVMDYALPTATGSFSKTGVGFQAQAAIFLGTAYQSINAGGGLLTSMGVATGPTEQVMLLARNRAGQTSNYTMGQIATTGIYAQAGLTGGAHTSEVQFTSFDADGFTANRLGGTGTERFGALFLGSPAKVVTTAQRTAVEGWDVTVAGLTPHGVLAFAENPQTATQSVATEGLHNAVGAATANGQCSIEINGHPNDTLNPAVTEEYSRSETAKLLTHYERTSADTFTKVADVEWSSATSGQLTLSQTDANTAAVLVALLVFCGAPHAGAVTYSGAATFATTATVSKVGAVAYGGTATFSAAGTVSKAGAVAFTASAIFGATSSHALTAAIAFSGSGTFNVAGDLSSATPAPPAVFSIGSGGSGGLGTAVRQRRKVKKPRRIPADGEISGTVAFAYTGVVMASGGATGSVSGIRAALCLPSLAASGIHNPSPDEIMFLLLQLETDP